MENYKFNKRHYLMLKISIFTSTSKKTNKNISVYFRITHNNQSTSYFPGVKILPKYWNSKQKIVNHTHPNSRYYNIRLNECKQSILDIESNFLKNNANYSVKDITSSLKKELDEDTNFKQFPISKLFETFYINLLSNNPSKLNSIKNYISTYKKFVKFENYYSATYFTSDINKQFLLNYKNFLFKEEELQNSTVEKHIKRFKTFIKSCATEGYEIDNSYKDVSVKVYDVPRFILSRDEIKALKDVKLTIVSEKKYRDLFIIQCYLGIRISDLKQINEYNIDTNEHTITLQMEKTDKPFICPVPKHIIPLVRKYFIDMQNIDIKDTDYNRIIKRVCMKAGLTNNVEVINYYNDEKKKSNKPKYEVVTTHTARRIFITYMFKTGKYTEAELMLVTRHTSITEFRKYLVYDDKEVIEKARLIANTDLYD